MREVLLIDTSVYLVLLEIPDVEHDIGDLRARYDAMTDQTRLLLPMATVWETGNHISRLANGDLRYRHACTFVDDVTKAFRGEAPYGTTHFPDMDELITWLAEFPQRVQCNKSPTKTNEGPSLADVSIIKEWERTCQLHPGSNVEIWSLDDDLSGYSNPGWRPAGRRTNP